MEPPHQRMTRNSSSSGIMLATKIAIVVNLTVGFTLLGLFALSRLWHLDILRFFFSNSAANFAIIILCPGMIALGVRDAARLRRSSDFYSMKSLPEAERDIRERIAARSNAQSEEPSPLEMTWKEYREWKKARSSEGEGLGGTGLGGSSFGSNLPGVPGAGEGYGLNRGSSARPSNRAQRGLDPSRNALKPSQHPQTARDGSWGNIWRRDSYSTRGIGTVYYSRFAWLVTVLYVTVGILLIGSKASIWMILYWMVPLGIVVLWCWRFSIYEWIDYIRDISYRDRKLERARRENEAFVAKVRHSDYEASGLRQPSFYPNLPQSATPLGQSQSSATSDVVQALTGSDSHRSASEQLDDLLQADPRPHTYLGTDWETYQRNRDLEREAEAESYRERGRGKTRGRGRGRGKGRSRR